jgi:DNA processing protein
MQKSNDPALYWIGLSSIPGVGRVTFRKLAQHFGSPERALSASPHDLRTISGLSDKVINEITSFPWQEYAERELEKAQEAGIAIIIADDAAYPTVLNNTPDPPLFLYVKGDLHQGEGIAIVGTRKPTNYGLTVTDASPRAISQHHHREGMARGIDTRHQSLAAWLTAARTRH